MTQKNVNTIFLYSFLSTNVWSEYCISLNLLSKYQSTLGVIPGKDTHPKAKIPIIFSLHIR